MKNMIDQKKTTITVSTIIAMVVVTALVISRLMGFSFASNTIVVSNCEYIFPNDTKMEVQFTGVAKKSVTSVTIPDKITFRGFEYRVISIKANALKGNTKVKKVTIGENIKVIGKNAFYGCKNLKSITIKNLNLATKAVGAAAFKGINSKAVVTVPKAKLAAYKKMLKAKGLTGKKQKVKGTNMVIKEYKEEDKDDYLGPDRYIPEPKTMFTLDDYHNLMYNIREADSYAIGDTIPVTVGFQMDDLMYGKWTERVANGKGMWVLCNGCHKMFDNYDDYCTSGAYTMDGCWAGSFVYDYDFGVPYKAWHWNPDDRACSATFHVALPEGLTYKKGTLKLFQMTKIEMPDSAYHVSVDGQNIMVTIDNIKEAPIHEGIAEKISITMDTTLNNNASAVNTVTASMSYDYGMGEKTVNIGNASVYAATIKINNVNAGGEAVNGAEFALYHYKTLKSGNIRYQKWVKVLDGIKGDPVCTIAGLSSGEYKLVQTAAPVGCQKMSNYKFKVSMSGNNGKLNTLSAADDSNRFVWEADLNTGVISTTIVY